MFCLSRRISVSCTSSTIALPTAIFDTVCGYFLSHPCALALFISLLYDAANKNVISFKKRCVHEYPIIATRMSVERCVKVSKKIAHLPGDSIGAVDEPVLHGPFNRSGSHLPTTKTVTTLNRKRVGL